MRNRMSGPQIPAPCRSWRRPVAWIALVSFLLNPLLVLGQDTGASPLVLQAGDTVRLSVPGRPDLASSMVLNDAGRGNIPQVGEVSLAGMTISEATLFIKQKLRLFYPNLDTLHLDVSRSGTTGIYVMGAVSRPGVQSFEEVPSLWDVIRSAGGPLENADLRLARIIREEDGVSQVHPVDLSGIMEGRALPRFEIRDGDTLIIPTLLEGTSGVPSAEGVKVFGGVGVSTVVPIKYPMPMLDVLMLAGAPTALAEMKEIYWVHQEGDKTVSTQVNLELFLKEGNPLGNPHVYPGDTVNVTYASPGWFWNYVPRFLVMLASVVTIMIGYDRIVNDN